MKAKLARDYGPIILRRQFRESLQGSSEKRQEFLISYYREMPEKDRKTIDRRIDFIKLSLIGTFALFAAIFGGNRTISQSNYFICFIFFPLIFKIVGMILEVGLGIANKKRGILLNKIENELGYNFWKNVSKNDNFFSRRPFTVVASLYWMVIVYLSAAVPIALIDLGL